MDNPTPDHPLQALVSAHEVEPPHDDHGFAESCGDCGVPLTAGVCPSCGCSV